VVHGGLCGNQAFIVHFPSRGIRNVARFVPDSKISSSLIVKVLCQVLVYVTRISCKGFDHRVGTLARSFPQMVRRFCLAHAQLGWPTP
jgi:hypothetical protein